MFFVCMCVRKNFLNQTSNPELHLKENKDFKFLWIIIESFS